MTKEIPSVPGANKLLDLLLARHDIKNDAALSRALDVAPPVISKIRHHHLSVSPGIILKIHEAFDMPVKEIRAVLA